MSIAPTLRDIREAEETRRPASSPSRQTSSGSLAADDAAARRALSAFVSPWDLPQRGPAARSTGDAYSDRVHRGADLAGKGAVAGIIGGAAALGAIGGAGLSALLAGLVGGVLAETGLGKAIYEGVRDGIEALGKGVAGVLGIDFTTGGDTPSGGTWTETAHPDGSRDRKETGKDGSEVNSHWGADGSFHETYDGNGYHSDYSSDGKGNSTFHADDAQGGSHDITVTADSYSTKDTDKDGNSSSYSRTTEKDGSSTVVTSKTDAASGTTTTTTTKYDKDKNKTSEETTATDKDGNPIPPPKPGDSEFPSDEGTDEGPRIGPGQLGRPRAGHPEDVVVGGGSGGDDEWGETPVRLRDAMRGIAHMMRPVRDEDDRDSSTQTEEDIRRKLAAIEVSMPQSGEDYINPKARSTLINRVAAAIVGGRRLRGFAQ